MKKIQNKIFLFFFIPLFSFSGKFVLVTISTSSANKDILVSEMKNKKQVKWGKRIRNKKAMSLITTNDVLEKIDEIMKKKN